ncbi:hypothetical protein Pla110_05930 [Polystyrenella longa]|uniref:Uncharacterized protein n=2 Tax=Polystyrenella longa TaxID=2528007 RepID=A0A518CI28_9PLAN|nr:hypothetical protein Pla110_05930 [Polystyrenella longa]
MIHVFDLERKKYRTGKPANIALEKDFYKIDVPSIKDPMIVEKTLAEMEGTWSTIIKGIILNEQMPEDEWMDDLIFFVAVLLTRTDCFKSHISTFITDIDLQHQSKIDKKNDSLFFVQQIFLQAIRILPILSRRNWSLSVCKDVSQCLVCSNYPISLIPTVPHSINSPPGLASEKTLVTLPISKKMLLLGSFDQPVVNRSINHNEIAEFNTETISNADLIFSSNREFLHFDESRKITTEFAFPKV